MGTGWRRAFCTTIPRDGEITLGEKQQQQSCGQSPSPSPRSCAKLGFLSGSSNPSTPRLQSQPISSPSLRCRTAITAGQTPPARDSTPKLQCTTAVTVAAATTPKTTKSPRPLLGSNPSSPRSPLKFSIFKNGLRLSRNNCGVCLQSVKTGQGTAIYTAECSHAFHFPCIAAHVSTFGSLVCPTCAATWRDVPLLAVHKNPNSGTISVHHRSHDVVAGTNTNKPKTEEKQREAPPPPPAPRDVKIIKSSDVRAYDDDEPLLSPTAGGRFVPIPEADENEEEEDEIEEFQGFFVNPNSSRVSIKSSDEPATDRRDLRNVEIRLLPESALISVNRGHETYAVALRVKAPPPPSRHTTTAPLLDPSHRAPIDLVTVLDVSGSMTGSKLQMLKRAMRLVISSLGSADRLSIVAFSAIPKRLLPLKRMTVQGQRSARRIIDRLVCGQGTSVGDALRKATKVLEDRRERNPVASIMLLSDGQDERVSSNAANQRRVPSYVSSTRFAHIEIPVHAFGFGEKGGYSHEPAEDAFAKCVGGLLSVVAQDLRLQLGFAPGSAPAEILAVYSCNGRPTALGSGFGSVRIGDLYAEEEREVLVELRVPAAVVGDHHVMSVRCSYKDPASQELVYGNEQVLLVPRPFAVGSSASKIERLRNLFIATRAVAEGRRLLDHNDFSGALHLLSSARAMLMQSSSASAEEYVRCLQAEMAEVQWRRQQQQQQQVVMQGRRVTSEREMVVEDENGEPLTPTSAWRAAERLAKVAMMKKSMNRVSDLHGFENARF